jgi:formylglycine-generating enzyme required for sulfatase activity
MKLGLNAKLAIGIIAGFGLLIAGFYAWKPLNITYYKYRIGSKDVETHKSAVKYLLEADAIVPVKEYYTNRYASKDVKERLAVVDELCAFGDKGKQIMYEIFRARCMREQVLIPAGSFMMGSENGYANVKPIHKVILTAFWMDKYEVTNEKYYVFYIMTDHKLPENCKNNTVQEGKENNPVYWISWEEARSYANWLGMRLPTESEWEYACRAGSTTDYCFGDNVDELGEYAWFDNNSGRKLHPIGQKMPNKWGLYDMHGNIWECCQDLYDSQYYRNSPINNPKGPIIGTEHVIRGGGYWGSGAKYCCSSYRATMHHPDYIGFRVCRSAGE